MVVLLHYMYGPQRMLQTSQLLSRSNKLVLHCSRSKAEAIILITAAPSQLSAENIPKQKTEGTITEYISSAKVLGLIVDDHLTFRVHATDYLKHCNQTWEMTKHSAARDSRLNNRSLTYLGMFNRNTTRDSRSLTYLFRSLTYIQDPNLPSEA